MPKSWPSRFETVLRQTPAWPTTSAARTAIRITAASPVSGGLSTSRQVVLDATARYRFGFRKMIPITTASASSIHLVLPVPM